jgi:hypothetical protein
MNINEFTDEMEHKKSLLELFKSNRKGNNRSVDGNKLSTLSVKIASKINIDNENIKALAALTLLSIASNLDAAPAQKIITKALGLL